MMEYKSKKKIDIKKWLLGGNSKIYAIILVLSVAAVFVVVKIASGVSNSRPNNSELDNGSYIDETVTDSENVSKELIYRLSINKAANFITVYKKNTENNNYDIAFKTFYCSVNSDVIVSVTSIESKYLWRKFSESCFGQYACRLSNTFTIHSVPCSTNSQSNIIIDAYNKLGKDSASIGSIYLSVDDAMWIYENCCIGTEVEIYENSSELPLIPISPITQIATQKATETTQKSTENETTIQTTEAPTTIVTSTDSTNQPTTATQLTTEQSATTTAQQESTSPTTAALNPTAH